MDNPTPTPTPEPTPAPVPVPQPPVPTPAPSPPPVQGVSMAEYERLQTQIEAQRKATEEAHAALKKQQADFEEAKTKAEAEKKQIAFNSAFNLAVAKFPLTEAGGKYAKQIADQAIKDYAAAKGAQIVCTPAGDIQLRMAKSDETPFYENGKELTFEELAKAALEENKLLANNKPGNYPAATPQRSSTTGQPTPDRVFPPGTPGYALQQKLNTLISQKHGT